MGIRHDLPAAIYALHHPGLGAVKIGSCLEPRAHRIGQHTSSGWILLADFGTPTGWDAMKIEGIVLRTLTPYVYTCFDRLVRVLPDHTLFTVETRVSRTRQPLRTPGSGFLRREQMPQGGATETFDAREVSPERAQLALWYAEAAHRARHYPPRADGLNWEQARRDTIAARREKTVF